jgi:hypothetical protein
MPKPVNVPPNLPIPTEAQIEDIRAAMEEQGAPFPKLIERIANGVYGIVFFSTDGTVFKLFRNALKPDDKKYYDDFIRAAMKGYAFLGSVKDELLKRGHAFPHMLDYGHLSKAITIGSMPYSDWQVMTRLNGVPLPAPRKLRRDMFMKNGDAMLRRITIFLGDLKQNVQLAARYHISVPAADQAIKTPFNTEWVDFAWIDKFKSPLDGRMQAFIQQLRRDIVMSTPSHPKTVAFIHGDLASRNLLRDKTGKLSAVDWDKAHFGLPEIGLWHDIASRPADIHNYCQLYNAQAQQPVNETLLTALSLSGSLGLYFFEAHDFKAYRSTVAQSEIMTPRLRRIVALAKRMHQLTGHKSYITRATGLNLVNDL